MIIHVQAGDLLTIGAGSRLRTGESMRLFPDRASALACSHDSGRTTRPWPGADARNQRRELAELQVPGPRRRPPCTITLIQTPDKPIADAPHPALR